MLSSLLKTPQDENFLAEFKNKWTSEFWETSVTLWACPPPRLKWARPRTNDEQNVSQMRSIRLSFDFELT